MSEISAGYYAAEQENKDNIKINLLTWVENPLVIWDSQKVVNVLR